MTRKDRQKKLIKAELLILIPILMAAIFFLGREYNLYPGLLEANALEISDKTTDKENENVAKINEDQSIELSPGTVTVKLHFKLKTTC